jgi:hypothetical protein
MDRYQLGQVFSPTAAAEWRVRQGEVVSVQSDYTATIKIAGSDVEVPGVRYLGEPTPGKGVWLLVNGTDLVILGGVAEAGRALAPRAYRTANQSISNASATPIIWEGVDSDAFGTFTASAAQLVVGVPGRYMAVGQVDFASNGTGQRSASVIVDGAVLGSQRVAAYSAVAQVNVTALPFTVANTASVSLWVEQNSSAALNVVASGSVTPGLGIYYLGA